MCRSVGVDVELDTRRLLVGSDLVSSHLLDRSRLEALRATGLLDAPANPTLERLTRIAARWFGVPFALASLVETDRQFFAADSRSGQANPPAREGPISHSFCQIVVDTKQPLVVEEAAEHALVCNHPGFTDDGVRAYLGMPLVTRAGEVLGSFCLVDYAPRAWTAEDQQMLADLADAACSELEARILATRLAQANEEYAQTLDTTTELVCSVDGEGRITYVNRAWCRAFDYRLQEVVGRPAIEFVAPEHRARYRDTARALRTTGEVRNGEFVGIGRYGRRVVCRGDAVATFDRRASAQGLPVVTGSRSFYRDVTHEYEVEQERLHLLSTLEATTDFVGIASADGAITYLNRAGRAMLALADDVEVGTLNARDFHPPETLALLETEGFPTAVDRGVWRGDGHILARTGESIPVSIVMTANPGLAAGDPPRFSAIMRDRRADVAAAERLRASEERLRAVVESSAVGVSVLDDDGQLLQVNEAFAELVGVPRASLLGRRAADFSPAEDAHITRGPVAGIRSGILAHATVEKRFVRPSGEVRWASLTLSRIPLGQGRFGIVGLTTDVTDRRAAEVELEENSAFLEAVLDSLSDGVVACDADGKLRLFNRASRELHRLDAEPLEKEAWAGRYGLYHTDGVTPLAPEEIPLARALAGEIVRDAEIVVATDSASRLLRNSAQPIRTADGRLLGAVVAMSDVTQRAQAEHERRLLLEVTQAMSVAADVTEAMRHALKAMCAAVEWEYGEVWLPARRAGLPSHESRALLLEHGPVWSPPGDAGLVWFRQQSDGMRFQRGEGLPGTVLETCAPVFIPDLAAETRVSHLGEARSAGLRAAYAVPILVEGEVSAVFTFFTRGRGRGEGERPVQVAEARVAVIAAVAAQLGESLKRSLAETALAEERAFLHSVLDSLSENVSVCAPDGRLVLFNKAATETHGLPADRSLTPEQWSEHYAVLEADGTTPFPVDALPHVRVLKEGRDVNGVEYTVHVPGREPRVLVANARVLRGADGTFAGSVCAARDMTEQKLAEAALRESEASFRSMLENLRTLAVILDDRGRVKFINDSTLTLTGWTRGEVEGTDWFSRFVPDAETHRRLFLRRMSGAQLVPHSESEIVTRVGRRRLIVWDNTVLRDATGRIVGTASIGQDVTEQRAMQERLAALSEHDELTGLLNRRGFVNRMDYAIKSGSRAARRDAVLYVDLDRFKPINDTYGHAAGDEALCAVAALLRATVRDSDFVGRLGGDEFAVYAVDVQDEGGAPALAERLQAAVVAHNRAARARGVPYDIAFSVGVAMLEPGDSRDALLARADAMLYQKKHHRT